MRTVFFLVLPALIGSPAWTAAQSDDGLLALGERYNIGDAGEDPAPDLAVYERFNKGVAADSVRHCKGFPCVGWVEDTYPDGAMKHRGFYEDGLLLTYRNYHPDGTLEREYRAQDNVRSSLRTYHRNGQLRSETQYVDGVALSYRDTYVTGQVRYVEERHRKEPYFVRMELYAADGKPISLLELIDKRNVLFLQREFHPGGALKCEGRARYDRARMDTQRTGTWKHFAPDGSLIKEEDYIDGKVHGTR